MKQWLTLSQSLVMTPQLQQAIKLLQLSRMELENVINTELVDNPVLEESDQSESTTQALDSLPTKDDKASAEENPQNNADFNWESYLENYKSTPSLPAFRKGEDDPNLREYANRSSYFS